MVVQNCVQLITVTTFPWNLLAGFHKRGVGLALNLLGLANLGTNEIKHKIKEKHKLYFSDNRLA